MTYRTLLAFLLLMPTRALTCLQAIMSTMDSCIMTEEVAAADHPSGSKARAELVARLLNSRKGDLEAAVATATTSYLVSTTLAVLYDRSRRQTIWHPNP